jgi:hypothetical protein
MSTEATFGNPQVVEETVDILLIGGGMAACGAAYEIMRWIEGTGLKVKLVDKAAMDRSGGSPKAYPPSTPIWGVKTPPTMRAWSQTTLWALRATI